MASSSALRLWSCVGCDQIIIGGGEERPELLSSQTCLDHSVGRCKPWPRALATYIGWSGHCRNIFYWNNKYTLSDSDNQISSEISSFRQMIREILFLCPPLSVRIFKVFSTWWRWRSILSRSFSEKVSGPWRQTLATLHIVVVMVVVLVPSMMKQWPLIDSTSHLPPQTSPVFTWCWLMFDSSQPFLSVYNNNSNNNTTTAVVNQHNFVLIQQLILPSIMMFSSK